MSSVIKRRRDKQFASTLLDRSPSVERVFCRMKNHRRLNNITVRRRRRVTVHSLIPVIVTQAMALAYPDAPRNCIQQNS